MLPKRKFGRHDCQVSILAMGCGNRLYAAYREDAGVQALQLAIDGGITYFDTAQSYGKGTSESWVGLAAEGRREQLFLATKTMARGYDEVLREFEASLARLRTSYVDLFHIHHLMFEEDLRRIETEGALRAVEQLRDQKAARFIGITSHTDPATLALALDRHGFDAVQMPLNAGLQGRSPDGEGFWKKTAPGAPRDFFAEALPPVPHPGSSFEDIALPVAVRRGIAVIAMKVTAQDGLAGTGRGRASGRDLIRYSLSLPITVASVGMPNLTVLRENLETARTFEPMPPEEMRALSSRLADENGAIQAAI
ncbi:MAG: aldo/keto reductase [Bryobacterales bacterium]|nr:aldo/keto reductase [Bryobacterales bacterium]